MSQTEMKDFDFSKLAPSYDGTLGKTSQRFYNLLLREVELKPGAKVLDIGCGTGALLQMLCAKYNADGYGIDSEENMIAEARKKETKLKFIFGNCDELPFESQTFDAAVNCMAFHHFGNRKGFAKEASRVLKPGGVLYIADPRFPLFVRAPLNGFFRLIRVNAAFYNLREMAEFFTEYGFTEAGTAVHGYAQVVKLQKNEI